jgi:hypothetical protein
MIMFIANIAIDLPSRFSPGDILDDDSAAVLQHEFIKRLGAQIRWRLSRGEITPNNLLSEALSMAHSFEFSWTPNDDDDPLTDEAMIIAKDLIIQQLAADGITIFPNLDNHARTLAQNSPELRKQALTRIETRYRIGEEAIRKLRETQ